MSAEDYGYESYDARVVSELAALRARIAELEAQPATLTPRQCNRLCFERGFEAGREAAAGAVRSLSHMPSAYEDAIRAIAMQPPAECGCNPLKPSESDAAMLDEWHKRM